MLNPNPVFGVDGEVDGGAKALELFRQLKPDVLLLDVTMLGLDGIETLRLLRGEHPVARDFERGLLKS